MARPLPIPAPEGLLFGELAAAVAVAAGLAGCAITPIYDKQVVCRVSDESGRRHFELISGKQKHFFPSTHPGSGPILTGTKEWLVFDDGTLFGRRTVFPNDQVDYAPHCEAVRFVGETVYIYPIVGPPRIAVSEDGGLHFVLRPTPGRKHPPCS